MGLTSIEWTDMSLNPIRARLGDATGHYCEKISPGCKNCYSSRLQPRFRMPQFQEQRRAGVEPFLDVNTLAEPLRRLKPSKFFWCDMSDMFGDWVPDEWIAACFAVMAATPRHVHQVLTKRATRLSHWFKWLGENPIRRIANAAEDLQAPIFSKRRNGRSPWNDCLCEWPLPNVWLGVSCENQETADERIPHLLETPAAVRFVSAEPLLGPIDLRRIVLANPEPPNIPGAYLDALTGHVAGPDDVLDAKIDWLIIGSESGPRARPMETTWARSLVYQAKAAGVAVFTKQIATPEGRAAGEKKGGNPAHWPPGDWPREFPATEQSSR